MEPHLIAHRTVTSVERRRAGEGAKAGVPRFSRGPTLGWLRVALALTVIDTHYGIFGSVFDYFLRRPASGIAFHFCGDGNLAVAGFFIMTGYLVAEILEKRYPSDNLQDLLHFIASRYLRIFPLYLLVAAVFVLILSAQGRPFGWLYLGGNSLLLPYGVLAFFSSKPLYTHTVIGAAWTLPLDLVFYPVGFLLFKRRWLLVATFSSLLLFYLVVWNISPQQSGTLTYTAAASWWHERFYTTAEPNMLAFVCGMIARIHWGERIVPQWLTLFSIGTLLWVFYFPIFIDYFGAQFVSLIALTVIVTALARNGMSRHEAFLGSLTYSIYLVHQPLQEIFGSTLGNPFALLAVAACLALVVTRFVEEGFIESRRRDWIVRWRPGGEPVTIPYNILVFTYVLLLGSSMVYYLLIFP